MNLFQRIYVTMSDSRVLHHQLYYIKKKRIKKNCSKRTWKKSVYKYKSIKSVLACAMQVTLKLEELITVIIYWGKLIVFEQTPLLQ